ncbi:hypothetical protein B484DRAFT_398989 [Ochromonadaceae sp. CCMP2298]|nr:hypothetical protein B484DRAFT_398989 [Ochromonadaceae sp. CCMP2298]|mmetsp:Transcript_2578/g.5666  ORF Transcript_2578/g.5666 Transcript_2578/m.5666 type:complete len:872 (-) Transcript_2578:116-2731(-)
MSDIRSFFGGNGGQPAKQAPKVVKPAPEAPKKVTEGSPSNVKENQSAVEDAPLACPIVKAPAAAPATSVAVSSSSSSSADVADSADSADPTASSDLELAPTEVQELITWKAGEAVPYLAVASMFEEVAKTSGRLEKENLFAKLMRAVMVTTPADLEVIVYLAANEVSPVYDGLELGIGDSLLVKAVCEATGRNKAAVEEAYATEGDLGTVALISRANQKTLSFVAKPKPLAARFVLEQFRQITQIKGDKAQSRKVDVIKALMVKCQGSEAKFIVRALQGKLRIGTAQQTVLVALAHAAAEQQLQLGAGQGTLMQAVRLLVAEDAEAAVCDEEEDEVVDKAELKKASKATEKAEKAEKAEKTEVKVVDVDVEVDAVDVDVDVDVEDEMVQEEDKSVQEMLDSIILQETPEAKSLRVHAIALLGGTKAVAKAHQRLPRDARWAAAEIAVKRAFSECNNLSILVSNLLTQPLHRLHRVCCLIVGVPVSPMLAKPTKKINEVLKRLSGQPFTMEYKYDGERAQVHLLPNGTVKIFSRSCEDNSEKYPDLKDVVRTSKLPEVTSCILDAEVVAYDREQRCLLPFQVLSTRKRKVEEGEAETQKVKVILQIFDLLQLNGKSLLRESLRTRRGLMQAAFVHTEGRLHFATGSDHVENGDTGPIESFLQEACAAMCEGLMVKTLDSNASYEPSKRSLNWLKLKKDYIEGMGVCDSVDLVAIGGFYGRGKRTNVYGAYLMACYDPERDEYQSVCKVGTGFKDEDLTRLTTQMKALVLPSAKRPVNYNVADVLYPDEWFDTAKVWELQAADLSKSSVHSGGQGRLEGGRGIGLRFPRYLKDRDDKKPEMATTAEQIVDMFYSQGLTEENNGEAEAAEDDWL